MFPKSSVECIEAKGNGKIIVKVDYSEHIMSRHSYVPKFFVEVSFLTHGVRLRNKRRASSFRDFLNHLKAYLKIKWQDFPMIT